MRLPHIKQARIQYILEGNIATACAVDFGAEVQFFYERFDCAQLLRAGHVRLVDKNDICELNLSGRVEMGGVVRVRARVRVKLLRVSVRMGMRIGGRS